MKRDDIRPRRSASLATKAPVGVLSGNDLIALIVVALLFDEDDDRAHPDDDAP